MTIADVLRLDRLTAVNADPGDRPTLEARYGQVWDPQELRRDFDVLGYLAPIVGVRRKADRLLGSLEFQHDPRFYFNWKEDD